MTTMALWLVFFLFGSEDSTKDPYEGVQPQALEHLRRADELDDKRQYAAAIEEYDKAIAIDPRPQMYWTRGNTHLIADNYDKAITDLTRAIELGYDEPNVYGRRGEAKYWSGDADGALQDLSKALELARQQRHTLYYTEFLEIRGQVNFKRGHYQQALDDLDEYLDIVTDDWMADCHISYILSTCPEAALRDGRKALELAQRACKVTEYEDLYAIEVLALAYAELGRFDKAIRWQKKLLGMLPEDNEKGRQINQKRLELFQARQPVREVRPH